MCTLYNAHSAGTGAPVERPQNPRNDTNDSTVVINSNATEVVPSNDANVFSTQTIMWLAIGGLIFTVCVLSIITFAVCVLVWCRCRRRKDDSRSQQTVHGECGSEDHPHNAGAVSIVGGAAGESAAVTTNVRSGITMTSNVAYSESYVEYEDLTDYI